MPGKTISNLSVGLFGDVSHFAHAFGHKATEATKSWAEGMKEAGSEALQLTGIAALAGSMIEGAFDFRKGFRLAAEFEHANVSLGAMLGNAGKASSVLTELREFSIKTPFEFSDLAATTRKLAAFGTTTDNLVPTIRMLANVAAGADTSVGELADLYIRVREEGRLSGREIREFTNAGIPLTEALAKSLSKSPAEIRKLLDAGAVTFPQVQKAFAEMTGQGGAFNRMLEKQADTLGGRWTTAVHSAHEAMQNISEGFGKGFDVKGNLSAATASINGAGDSLSKFSLLAGFGATALEQFARKADRAMGGINGFDELMSLTEQHMKDSAKEAADAAKAEAAKPIPLEFNPRVHNNELVKWGSAQMYRIQQEWAGQFPKMARLAAHAAAPPAHHGLANALTSGVGSFYELLRSFAPHPKPQSGKITVGPQPAKPLPKGITFGPTPEKPVKPAGFDARIKSLQNDPTAGATHEEKYVDSHGHRHSYDASHPDPFQHVLTPGNIKDHLSKDGFTPKQAQDATFYLQQMWLNTQTQNNQVADF